MDDNSQAPAKRTWFGYWFEYGRESIDTIETQRARQFELLVEAKGKLREVRTNWREAKRRGMPETVVAGLEEAMEGLQDCVDDAKESYALVSAERDRRVSDNRANLSLILSGAAFCVSGAALVVTLLAFLLKGWH